MLSKFVFWIRDQHFVSHPFKKSTAEIIFLISSFFGSDPNARMATFNSFQIDRARAVCIEGIGGFFGFLCAGVAIFAFLAILGYLVKTNDDVNKNWETLLGIKKREAKAAGKKMVEAADESEQESQ